MRMPVYYLPEVGEAYVRKPKLGFPSLLKFADNSWFTLIAEGEANSMEEAIAGLQIEMDEEK